MLCKHTFRTPPAPSLQSPNEADLEASVDRGRWAGRGREGARQVGKKKESRAAGRTKQSKSAADSKN